MVNHLTAQNSTFASRDVIRALAEQAQVAGGGIKRVEEAMKSVTARGDIVRLQRNRYTTREILQIELGAYERAKRMPGEVTHGVDKEALQRAMTSRPLSDEQRAAVAHVTDARQIAFVEGMAGTGKSHMLGAAREAWEDSGYTVRGAALAGKAAKGLQDSSGIPSQTVHSLLGDIDTKRDHLTARTVVVVDEAGMVGSRHFGRLLKHVDDVGAKVVFVGDARQLQPIEAGQMFGKLSEDLGSAKLIDIRRQRDAADRDMVQAFARGDARTALESLSGRGRLHATDDSRGAMQKMVGDWSAARDQKRPGDDLMLAATRADVRELNSIAREVMRSKGSLGREMSIETNNGPRFIAEGDRIVITRNSKVLGVNNSDFATVTALCERHGDIEMTAKLDSGREVAWRAGEHRYFDHGYAATAHKGQGATVERSYVLAHESMSAREWSYVVGSRAREAVHIYTDRFTAKDLERVMSRNRMKDTALDHLAPKTIAKYAHGKDYER